MHVANGAHRLSLTKLNLKLLVVDQECLRRFALTLRAVVLDMDGTITEFNIDFRGARQQVLTQLEKMNLKTPEMTSEASIYSMLKLLRSRLNPRTYEELRLEFYKLLEDMEMRAAKDVVL